jgi:hypothetical protein
LSIRFFHTYAALSSKDRGNWEIQLSAYRYEVYDRDDTELLAYHWHPAGLSPVATPHLHVRARHASIDLAKRHLPTGPVTVVAFLRSLITEFGVEPLRTDWDQILRDV